MSRFLSIAFLVTSSMAASTFPTQNAISLNGTTPINMRLIGAGIENLDRSEKSPINATCILTDFEVACGSFLSMSLFSKV